MTFSLTSPRRSLLSMDQLVDLATSIAVSPLVPSFSPFLLLWASSTFNGQHHSWLNDIMLTSGVVCPNHGNKISRLVNTYTIFSVIIYNTYKRYGDYGRVHYICTYWLIYGQSFPLYRALRYMVVGSFKGLKMITHFGTKMK